MHATIRNQGRRQEFFQGRAPQTPPNFQGRGFNPDFLSFQWSKWKNFMARGGYGTPCLCLPTLLSEIYHKTCFIVLSLRRVWLFPFVDYVRRCWRSVTAQDGSCSAHRRRIHQMLGYDVHVHGRQQERGRRRIPLPLEFENDDVIRCSPVIYLSALAISTLKNLVKNVKSRQQFHFFTSTRAKSTITRLALNALYFVLRTENL